jgi:AP-3 complex subunit mu
MSGRFSLTLSSKVNRIVEDIVVSIHLGSGASSVSATATGDRPPMSMGGPTGAGKRQDAAAEGFAGGGNWEFDPHSRVSYRLMIEMCTELMC